MIDIPKKKNLIFCLGIILLVLIGAIAFFDKGLAVGLFLLVFLTTITFLLLSKIGMKDKELYSLLLIALLIHLVAVLFIYYTGFKPFGGGADFEGYNQTAIEISQRFKQGNFSLEGLHFNHYFPLLIGIIYSFTLPEMIVGQLFTVWLTVISVLFFYLIVLEINGSKKWAFLISLIVCFYPSYIYFGSLLLKDTVIIPLVLSGLLLFIKMMKGFSWWKFAVFYIILTALIHLRFYVGYALLFSFVLCWFLISSLNLRKRVIYGIIIVLLLGFSPQILGYGYYGTKTLQTYLNQKTITVYREVVYAPAPPCCSRISAPPATPTTSEPPTTPEPPEASGTQDCVPPAKCSDSSLSGLGSSFVVETGFEKPSNFIINYFKSFIYSLLGPFPWQIRYQRQLFSLLETIPWYFLFIIIFWGIIVSIKRKGILGALKRYQFAIPLLVFAIMSLAAFSLFITNFGIIVRIRILSFIALLGLMSLSFNDFNLNNKYLKNINKYGTKIYEKIFNYWGSWFYRFLPCRYFSKKRG